MKVNFDILFIKNKKTTPSMKKQILKLLTTTYKIPLSSCALNYLSSTFYSYTTLELFIEENIDFLRTKKPLKKEDIIECEKLQKNILYEYEILKYTESNLLERYNFFKNKISATIIGVLIFEENRYFLETEENKIELRLEIDQDIYLEDNIFIGCNGVYEDKLFVVNEIVLPQLDSRGKNNKLQNKNAKIIIVHEKHKDKINMVDFDIKIILNDISKSNFYSACKKEKDFIYLSSLPFKNLPYKNSMLVNLYSSEIFISLDTFKSKGIFWGENVYHSYIKTILSQYITNTNIQSPVLNHVPDIFVTTGKVSFVTNVENRIFVSIAEEENKFLEINSLEKICEIKNF
ncbi:hypothetical protein SLOPH_1712 [Spraguea lophii 42_110]|uniref:Uncharacterized protein n=1 Tax=Spraguea lophii (strain 42_110) TaxID=1358809 RepID=S7WA41_SPRLO|nr:hypothetical protein SLOPH_1712 [Spraguea lophii 42_110]